MKNLLESAFRNALSPFSLYKWWRYQRSRTSENNLFLVTMNHAGTHWIRTLMTQALIDLYELNDDIVDIKNFGLIPPYHRKNYRFKYNETLLIPRIQQSHSPYKSVHFKGGRVIFLVRDLRDVLVSHYRNYIERHDLDLCFSSYLRSETIPHNLKARIKFLNSWGEGSDKALGFHLVRFEDLKNSIDETLLGILNFSFPGKKISEALLEKCQYTSSITKMQELEKKSPSPLNNNKTVKVRAEKNKNYKAYYSEDDKDFFTLNLNKYLKQDYGYDYSKW